MDAALKAVKLVLLACSVWLVVICVQIAIEFKSKHISQDVVQVSARSIEKQLQCMSRNIYWEAANEPFEGKVAVAQVTINRKDSGKFPDTVCGVVHQKTSYLGRVVCQFSWLCEANNPLKPIHPKRYAESEEVAKMVLLEGFRLPNLKEAIYYHADYVQPNWGKQKITQIGRHIFYKE